MKDLAAFTETPCIIVDIQRAGPATGQATRVGSGDIMHVMGKIIEVFPKVGGVYPPRAYHIAFSSCLLGIAITLAFYGFSKDTKPHVAPKIEINDS